MAENPRPFSSIYNVDLPFFFFFFRGSQTTGIPYPIDMHGAHTTSLLLGCTRRYTCKDKRQMKKKERKRINFLPERIDKSTHTDA
jgi:ribosomal protein S6E (S10)